MEPPNQFFTDELIVGAMAFANDGGSLIGGVDRVRFHLEGETIDVVEPSFRRFADVNGITRSYWGYWAKLKKPAEMSGEAQLYVEAIPADATMQKRVIGPFSFFASEALHDYSVTVNSDGGADYATFEEALDYLTNRDAQNPLVTITGGGPYTANRAFPAHTGAKGWCSVTATTPVEFSRPSYIGDVASDFRHKYDGLRFVGSNITFDMRHVRHIRPEDTRPMWFDGCRFTNSAGRADAVWRRGRRPIGALVRGSPYFTECHFEDVDNPCNTAALVRGCSGKRLLADWGGDAHCMIYNDIDDLSGKDNWLEDVAALDVHYDGDEAPATLAKSGGATGVQTFTARWGANSATFRVSETEAFYNFALGATYDPATDGQGYFVEDVANWLNSLPGWSATVLDNSRAACWLSVPANRGLAFAAKDAKSGTLNLVRCYDIHGDFFQQRFGGLAENHISAFNTGKAMAGQIFFVSSTSPARDFYFVGNAFANVVQQGTYLDYTQTSSQSNRSAHSNVVFAHNTLPTQRLALRTDGPDGAKYSNDNYCLIANNALLDLLYIGTPTAQHLNVTIKDNAIDGIHDAPVNSTGTIAAGDYASKFADSLAGDFSPAGELLTNLRAPVFAIGLSGRKRGLSAPLGAAA